MLEVRYPNVEVRITEEYPWGYDGEDEEFYSVENPDAAGILERVRGALKDGGVGDGEIEAYTTEATSRCYNHLLLTTMTWVRGYTGTSPAMLRRLEGLLRPGPHRLTIPWGSRRDASRLSARSRMAKASWMPWVSTLGMGSSSCLRRACAMRSAIWRR